MTFYKRLIALVLGSSSTLLVSKSVSPLFPFNKLSPEELEKIFDSTKTPIIPTLASHSSIHPTYSLFSTNLHSFSKYFLNHFYKWALFQWVNVLLNETDLNAYVGIKTKAFNDLVNKKHDYVYSEEKPDSWKLDNFLIGNSNFDSLFDELFWKELFVHKNKILIPKNQLLKYGDPSYQRMVYKFQNFIYKRWLDSEIPKVVCKKTWDYAKSFPTSQSPYKSTITLPDAPNYNFPYFDEATKSSFKSDCSEFVLVTASDLQKWESGNEIMGLVRQFSKDITEESISYSTSTDPTDPTDVFLTDTKKDSSVYSVAEIFSDSSKNSKTATDFKDSTTGETLARTEKGITLFKKAEEGKSDFLNSSNLSLKRFNLLDELKKFWKKDKEELLALYFNYLVSQKGGIFRSRSWNKDLYDVVRYSALFSYHLKNSKRLFEIMRTISKFKTQFESHKFSNKDKAPEQVGIFAPATDRNLSEKKLEFSDWLGDMDDENDGMFPKLNKYLNTNLKVNPYIYSVLLKESLKKYISSLNISSRSDSRTISYFFNDYFLDNVYWDFLKSKSNLIHTSIKNINILNNLNFDFDKNELSKFSSNVLELSGIDYRNKDDYTSLIEDSIVDVYYGNLYNKEKIEDRVNYGGYKWEDPNSSTSFCRRIMSTSGSKLSDGNDCGDKLKNNREQYSQKLVNYFVTKNWFFNEYGYEISSIQMTEYLSFLSSFRWLTKNSFHNLKKYVSKQLPAGYYGALIWLDNIDNIDNQNQSNVGNLDKESLKDIKNYFSASNKPEIFNPLFSSGNAFFQKKIIKTSPYNRVLAFAKTGPSEFTEFSGFKGLITPQDFKDLPDNLKKSIFTDFDRSNTPKNKNYASQASSGWGYGYVFEDQVRSINEMIDSFSTIKQLEEFLENVFREDQSRDDFINWKNTIDSINLKDRKDKVKELISNDKFKSSSKRFIGFLRNPELSKSIYSNNPFFVPESESSSKGNLIFMTQVNKYDFQDGFNDFVNVISQRTLFKMISSMSLSPIAQRVSVDDELIKKGVIL